MYYVDVDRSAALDAVKHQMMLNLLRDVNTYT